LNTNEVLNLLTKTNIPKSLMRNSPFPQQMTRKLIFHNNTLMTSGVKPIKVFDLIINGASKPDGSTIPSGFNELALIYPIYKVMSVKIKFTFANNEPSIPVSIGMVFRDNQPSLSLLTWINGLDSLEVSPSTGSTMVGETTGMSIFKSKTYKVNCGDILGNPMEYLGDHEYSSLVTTTPVGKLWVGFILLSDVPGTNLTNGGFIDIYMEMTTMFYGGLSILE